MASSSSNTTTLRKRYPLPEPVPDTKKPPWLQTLLLPLLKPYPPILILPMLMKWVIGLFDTSNSLCQSS